MNGLFKSTRMQSASAPSAIIPAFSPKARAPLRVAAAKISLSKPASAFCACHLLTSEKSFISSSMLRLLLEEAPSVPSVIFPGSSCWSFWKGKSPETSLRFEAGLVVRNVPDCLISFMSSSSKWMAWAKTVLGPSRFHSANLTIGETLYFPRQSQTSLSVSQAWICR